MNTLKDLSDLNEETMSIINLQLAIDALESGNVQFGLEALQASAKNGKNAAALYNLGICYERGIGVEQDRSKVMNRI
jgi:TPR repeat protein